MFFHRSIWAGRGLYMNNYGNSWNNRKDELEKKSERHREENREKRWEEKRRQEEGSEKKPLAVWIFFCLLGLILAFRGILSPSTEGKILLGGLGFCMALLSIVLRRKSGFLSILSVLLSCADVIMLDEPTLGMDGFLIEQLEELIASLKASGKTVVMISHEMPLVFRTVDNAVVLNKGKKVFEGSKEELAREDALFESINISLPPVVVLSKQFGLKKICFNVEDFCEEIEQQIGSSEQG